MVLLNGFFGVLKPTTWTSRAVVDHSQYSILQALKTRQQNEKISRPKIGHGGTLDPIASGVMILGIGDGTKHLRDFLSCSKDYIVTGMFGKATDTYDSLGKLTKDCPYDHITKEIMEASLQQFRGNIQQIPPIYSALRQNGRRLYEYARSNITPPVPPTPRPVIIHSLCLSKFSAPIFVLNVTCGGGTYMRSLVHDIGTACGSAAHMIGLVRIRQGGINMQECISLYEVGNLERIQWGIEKAKQATSR